MEAMNIPIFRTIATLTSKTTPFLGWTVLFASDLTPASIKTLTPPVEHCLNDYLQRNVNVVSNNLVVPFTCKLVATTANSRLFNFKVEVFRKFIFFKLSFPYPAVPILSLNNFQLVKGPGVESQTSGVALKPPAPVK